MQANPTNNSQSQQPITDRIDNISKIDATSLVLLIDLLPLSVQVYNADGTQLAVNKRWEEHWNLKAEDTIGRFKCFQNEQALSSNSTKP